MKNGLLALPFLLLNFALETVIASGASEVAAIKPFRNVLIV